MRRRGIIAIAITVMTCAALAAGAGSASATPVTVNAQCPVYDGFQNQFIGTLNQAFTIEATAPAEVNAGGHVQRDGADNER